MFSEHERHDIDGTVTTWKEKGLVQRECGLFSEDQTAPYRGQRRTWAVRIFWNYFVRFGNKDCYLWWVNEPLDGSKPGWRNCTGRLQEGHLKNHLKGAEKYGVRGGKWTRFGGIDLDLHDGDLAVFLDQFRILLDEFHGKEGWHFQVSNEDAGGVHLVQTFRNRILVASYRESLRNRLKALDERYPDLADRARATGMKTLGELEIFPDPAKGFRLPLCVGRTMLLDRPLELVFNKRMKRKTQDVLRYVSWLSLDEKQYMPAEEVFEFVRARLRKPQPKPEADKEKGAYAKPKRKKVSSDPGCLGSLGKMKGCFAQKLSDFWLGNLSVADTLNTGIRLLALVLPYCLKTEEEAIALIEKYIQELPDTSFSSRLSAGNTAEVRRIVVNTVRQVYQDNGGQPDPDSSTTKLKATVKAWKKQGFDPTDKSTWHKATAPRPAILAPDFTWTPEEIAKLVIVQRLLKTSLQVTSDAVKSFLRLVKGYIGEIAIAFVNNHLESLGIKCGHHGKANNFLTLLRDWDWLRMTVPEKWHSRNTGRKGRARTYVVGEAMIHKFQKSGQGVSDDVSFPVHREEKKRIYCFTSHFYNRESGLASGSPVEGEGEKNLFFTSHFRSLDKLGLPDNVDERLLTECDDMKQTTNSL